MKLEKFHPELINLWERFDVSKAVKPQLIEQPPGLYLDLLPFQLEGISWLMQQELQGQFDGGILAVRLR